MAQHARIFSNQRPLAPVYGSDRFYRSGEEAAGCPHFEIVSIVKWVVIPVELVSQHRCGTSDGFLVAGIEEAKANVARRKVLVMEMEW